MYTKGPWKHVTRYWNEVVLGPDGVSVCTIPTLSRTKFQVKANINLICACPEMINALETARVYIALHNGPDDILNEINFALHKAYGHTTHDS